MKWEDLSTETLDVMEEMGNFGPTTNPSQKLIKGYIGEDQEGQSYMDCLDLRSHARALNEVADWLDKRFKDEGVRR